jgi:hypothetical protein
MSHHRLAWLSGGAVLMAALVAVVVLTNPRGVQANPMRTFSFHTVPDTNPDGSAIQMLEARVISDSAVDAHYEIRIVEGGPGTQQETMRGLGDWDTALATKTGFASVLMDAPPGRPFQAMFTIRNAAGGVEAIHTATWTAP